MAYPQGQLISAPLTNGSETSAFGTHIDYLGTGGRRAVMTLAARNAIVTKDYLEYDNAGSGQRRYGMVVSVAETERDYILYIPQFFTLPDSQRLAALKDNGSWMDYGDFLNFKINNNALTQDETDAIKNANSPSATNVFITQSDLDAAIAGVQVDDSNYAKLNVGNSFHGRQVIREDNVAAETTIAGDSIEIRADNSSNGYGKLRVKGVDNQGLIESALILDSPHVQVVLDPVLGKDVINLDYLNAALANFSGGTGSGITGFIRNENVLTIQTDNGDFEVDLNETTYGPAANLLSDSEFQQPFISNGGAATNGGQWFHNGGWSQSPGQAIGNSAQYLFQDYTIVPNQFGDYMVNITIESIASATVALVGTEIPTTVFSLPGTYSIPFTIAQSGNHRIHLFGDGLFNGVVNSVAIYSNSSVLQRPYGYELFVHKEGTETIRGNKTFTDALYINANSGVNSNGQSSQVLSVKDKAPAQNVFIANLLAPNMGDNIFLSIGAYAGQNGQSALFGFSKENGIPAAFFTTFGRPASDFKILNTNGYIGMGTSNPSERLEVVGNVKASGFNLNNMKALIVGVDGFNTPIIQLGDGQTSQQVFIRANSIIRYFSDYHYFHNKDGSLVLTIDGVNGAVGIGASTPTEKLEVNGNVKAVKFIGDASQLVNYRIAQNGELGVVRIDGGSNGIVIDQTGLLSINYGIGLTIDSDSSQLTVSFVNDINNPGVAPYVVATPQAIKNYVNSVVSGATPAPVAGTQEADAHEFTATADGAQTIPLGRAVSRITSVLLLEAGSTTATRLVYKSFYSVSGNNLTITNDAQIAIGDKIIVTYKY